MVENVEHDYPDTWTAEIEGSDLYSVKIQLQGDEIVSWDCDCPYDHGDICKHVVAFLLYIKENREEHPVTLEIPPSSTQEQLTEILKQTGQKELISFLSQYADKHPDFYQTLVSSLHPKKKVDIPKDYKKEIEKCFQYTNDTWGYPQGVGVVAGNLDQYIEKAKSLIKLDCREEAITILLHIIREIGDSYEEYEDYDGDLGCVCQEAAELITEMIETDLPDNLLKDLTDEIGEMIKNNNYANYDLADLNQMLFSISLKTLNYDNSISILDEALKNEPDSFRSSSLVKSKIELLEKAGKEDDVEKEISHYLYLPEIRKIRLKDLTSKKQYANALALIDDGIGIAEEKRHPGTVTEWKDEKLSVYKSMGNNEKTIELAEDLFISGRDSMKYYHILKTVISKEKWVDYLDDFLCESAKQLRWGLGDVLAKIYIEEKYWNRLMDYVEKNIRLGKYNALETYEPYLKPQYPERMLAFYRTQLTDYAAKNMGRDHYKYVADVLKKTKKYPNGNEVVNELMAHFKSVYSNRRAMIEELGK
jgi:tetratricopeptide (TPR) repeat protein